MSAAGTGWCAALLKAPRDWFSGLARSKQSNTWKSLLTLESPVCMFRLAAANYRKQTRETLTSLIVAMAYI